jgi:hypothetical protein
MHDVQLFSHRPPSTKIHLLYDPEPERWNPDIAALFSRKETVTGRQAYIAGSKRLRPRVVIKK